MNPARDETAPPTFRTQRLRLVWLLAIPFFFLATPFRSAMIVGFSISIPGLLLRALSAGSIHKERELATGGPYRHIRHPLYLGSFLVGLGFSVAGGRWWFPLLYLALFVWLYGRAITAEEVRLASLYGEEYRAYRESVPAFLPRLKPRPGPRPGSRGSGGVRFWLYRRNREWQAALGTLAGFGLLLVRMYLMD